MAIVVLAGIGVLVSSVLMVAVLSRRSAAAVLELVDGQYDAESRAAEVVTGLTVAEAMGVPVGQAPAGLAKGELTRYGTYVWLGSGQSSGALGVMRRVGRLITARPPVLAVRQALATPGVVEIQGAVAIDQIGGTEGGYCASDRAEGESGYASAAYEAIEVWAERATISLADGVTVTPNPVVIGSDCSAGVVSNWGDPLDPLSPCRTHYPMVSIPGDAVIEGGLGQGGLVVAGDLTVRGGFRFNGLVIVGGSLTTEFGGAWFEGLVQVNDDLAAGTRLSDTRIRYSACVLRAALARFGELSVVGRIGWFQLY